MTATTSASGHEVRKTGGLVIEDLGVSLTGKDVDVVDDIDLVLKPGEVVGLVGESGSGKTTVGTSLLAYSRAGAYISSGKVLLEERDVLQLPWKEVRKLRGEEIAYVPQDPASALNPSIRIGKQLVELQQLRGIGTTESRLKAARDGLDRGRPARTTTSSSSATPTSSPAVRCSASPWPWRSCPSPRCSSSTSRPPASTSPPRRWCSTPWPSSAGPTASARSTSPTTSP